MVTIPVFLAALAILIAIYYWLTKTADPFKKHGVLHVPPLPIVGNMGPMVMKTSSMADVLQRSYDLHPDAKYVGFYEFFTPIVVLRDVDIIKTVGVKNFESFPDHRKLVVREMDPLLGGMLFSLPGEQWKDTRAMLSPTFTSSKIKSMFTLVSNCALRFAEHLSNLPVKERELEGKALFNKYTNDVIATCVFGMAVDSLSDPNNVLYENGTEATNFVGLLQSTKLLLMRNMPRLSKWLGVRLVSKKASKFFTNVIADTVKTREENNIYRSDMIQMLLETKNKRPSGKTLDMDDIINNVFGFYFGGVDTVAVQTCWIIYHLAVNPDVQRRLQIEIDEMFEKTEGQVTYDAVSGMEYMDAVINEAMRLHPVPPFLDRMCVKDFELPPALPGGEPFTVKAGTNVWIPVFAIQRDPKYFENPEKFDPERFLNDGKRIMGSGTFMPFGVGPRMCIGNRFALIEMKVLLSHLLSRCDIKPSSRTRIPVELGRGVLNTTARGGFWTKIEPRKDPSPFARATVANGTCKTRDE